MIEIISKDNKHVKLSDKEAKYSRMLLNLFYFDDEDNKKDGEKKVRKDCFHLFSGCSYWKPRSGKLYFI